MIDAGIIKYDHWSWIYPIEWMQYGNEALPHNLMKQSSLFHSWSLLLGKYHELLQLILLGLLCTSPPYKKIMITEWMTMDTVAILLYRVSSIIACFIYPYQHWRINDWYLCHKFSCKFIRSLDGCIMHGLPSTTHMLKCPADGKLMRTPNFSWRFVCNWSK